MRISVSLPELDLGELTARLLPAGATLQALELDDKQLHVVAKAPIVGEIALRADVRFEGAALTLSRFRVEGGMLARALIGGRLTEKIAELDWKRGALRAWGETDGERLHLRWDA